MIKNNPFENDPSVAASRISLLADPGSFKETLSAFRSRNSVFGYEEVSIPGEGVMTGYAAIEGKNCCIIAQSPDRLGASFGRGQAHKIVSILDQAEKSGYPVICLWDSAGARIQEGPLAVDAYSMVLKKMAELSGVVPVISVAEGGMNGCAAFFAPLSDIVIAIREKTDLGIKGATVTASSFGVGNDTEKLNGADRQMEEGNIHFVCDSEEEAYETVKRLLVCLPSNNIEDPYDLDNDDDLSRKNEVFEDIREMLISAADGNSFLEIQKGFAPEMMVGFASFGGIVSGVMMNRKGEALTAHGLNKASRFVSLLDSFNIPLISFTDNEGTLPETGHGMLGAAGKLIYALGEATMPVISVLAGRAVGEGYVTMPNRGNGADVVLAFSDAKIGCLGEEQGSIILFEGDKSRTREYEQNFMSVSSAMEHGLVDRVIEKEDLRTEIIGTLDMVISKRVVPHEKKHGIMP